jgi:hypothetical protein
MKNKILIFIAISFLFTLNSCSSVFSAGVSGKVVDAESTTNPKEGIADVEVYAYVNEKKNAMLILIHINLIQDFLQVMINIILDTQQQIPMELLQLTKLYGMLIFQILGRQQIIVQSIYYFIILTTD